MSDTATNTGTTTTTTTAATGGTEQTWWSGLDDETKGYVQNKGLTTKPVTEAFVAVSKFHREAEKMIGAPANEVVRLPKEANSPEWASVYKRLGALGAAEEYKFEGLKRAGDKPLEPALIDTLRKAAFSAHLTPDAAASMAKEVVSHLDNIETGKLADETAKLAAEKKLLKDNWGNNAAVNMVVARAAVSALDISEDAVIALEKVVGYSKVMEMFRLIGSKIGEDRFVSSGGNQSNAPMTKEAAIAEKASLKRDTAFVKRYLDGGVDEKRRMEAIDRIISGVTA